MTELRFTIKKSFKNKLDLLINHYKFENAKELVMTLVNQEFMKIKGARSITRDGKMLEKMDDLEIGDIINFDDKIYYIFNISDDSFQLDDFMGKGALITREFFSEHKEHFKHLGFKANGE